MAGARPDRAYLLYRGGAALFHSLPRRLSIALGGFGGAIAARRMTAVREVVAANFSHIATPDALDALTNEAFVQYGRYWAATARLRASDAASINDLVVVEGMEHFDRWREQAVLYALPHLGAWEIGGLWAIQQGLDLTTVAEPASSPRLSEFFTAARSALGLHVVELGNGTATELLGVLESGRSVALVADRDLLGDGFAVRLFDAPTHLPGGPALLALRSGAPLIPAGTYLQRDGSVRAVFLPPLDTTRKGRLRDDVSRVTSELASAFEVLIRRDPAQWHVFQPIWPAGAPGSS